MSWSPKQTSWCLRLPDQQPEARMASARFARPLAMLALFSCLGILAWPCAGQVTPAIGAGPLLSPHLLPGKYPRLMPLGDSITVGVGADYGYRGALQLLLAQLGTPYEFVGSQTQNSLGQGLNWLLDPDHEGHGGYTIAQAIDANGWPGLQPSSIETWLEAADPELILLHLGTNDMFQPTTWQDAGRQLERLLLRIRGAKPRARTLVAGIVPTAIDEFNLCVESFNRSAIEVLRRRQVDGQKLGRVDMYPAGFPFQSGDGSSVHPDQGIYLKMASLWLEGILAPDLASQLPPPEAPSLATAASAASADSNHPAALLSDGNGLSGDVVLAAAPGAPPSAWVSAPFPVLWAGPGTLVPSDPAGTWVEFHFQGAQRVESCWLWNGRGAELTQPNGEPDFRVWDNARRLAVFTLDSAGQWIDRGMLDARRPPRTRWHPGERFAVDWPDTWAVRLEIRELDIANLSPGQPAGMAVSAISEVRFHGQPEG